jgi:hypothetical protein
VSDDVRRLREVAGMNREVAQGNEPEAQEWIDTLTRAAGALAREDASRRERNDAAFAIGQLRHLYAQMVSGGVSDTAGAARGLLGPSIERLERLLAALEGP